MTIDETTTNTYIQQAIAKMRMPTRTTAHRDFANAMAYCLVKYRIMPKENLPAFLAFWETYPKNPSAFGKPDKIWGKEGAEKSTETPAERSARLLAEALLADVDDDDDDETTTE